MVHWRAKRRRQKKQRPYQVRLLELDKNRKIIGVVSSRDFEAVDTTGAKRASSHWYKGLYPDDVVAGAHTQWQIQPSSASDSKIEFHFCQTAHGLLAFHATDGKDIARAEIEEEVDETDPDDVMERLIENPEQTKKGYRGRSAALLGIMERYFSYTTPFITDSTDGLLAADIVYDWTGVPSMLARAWGVEQRNIRSQLYKKAIVECPQCGTHFEYWADRVVGGFEPNFSGHPCLVCRTLLIEINSDKLSWVPNEWRTNQSPHWIAPNPEQELAFAIQRLLKVMAEPNRYLAAGWARTTREPYFNLIKSLVNEIHPQARISRYCVPKSPNGRTGERMKYVLKEWSSFLGAKDDDFKYAKQREEYIFNILLGSTDWLILEQAENLGSDLELRLRNLDHQQSRPDWARAFKMIWFWNEHNYDPHLLQFARHWNENEMAHYLRRYSEHAVTPSLNQIMWLPDPQQVLPDAK